MSDPVKRSYEFGPFRLDPEEYVLVRNGQVVPLTPKVFETLLVLVENGGHVVGKEELYRKVWQDAFVEETNLTKNISILRKVLSEGDAGTSFIETVPKRGYRFVASVRRSGPEDAERRSASPPYSETAGQPDAAVSRPLASSGETWIAGIKERKVAVIIALLVLIGGAFYLRGRNNAVAIESIAVMPFVNESGNPEIEYLADGMTETLINGLSQIPGLSVKGRSSVLRYKGKETGPRMIGNELGVQTVLSGRLVERGGQLTLNVELIDAETENVLWGERFERNLSDLEIARDVLTKLRSKLSGTDQAQVSGSATTDPEAYRLYLKGRYQWNKRTGESLKMAVEYFNQAIEKDPGYALPYSGLAESYVLFPIYSVALPVDSMPKAKAAALRAIELDDSLAETHVALGIYYSNFAWNQPAAEREFRRAIELNPNYANAHQQFGVECLTAMGKFDEAVAEGKRAEELDPLSPIIGVDVALILIRARRFDEALDHLNRVLALDPNFWLTYWYLGMVYDVKKQYADAVMVYRKALSFNDNSFVKALLIRSLAHLGQRDEAIKLLGELQAEADRRYVSGASLAIAYYSVGERARAFAFLDREIADRGSRPKLFHIYSIWDDFRDEPRFVEMLRQVELARLE